MGWVNDIAQRKGGNNPFSSAVACARSMALQAGCDVYLLCGGKRGSVWSNLRMLLASGFCPFMRLKRQCITTRFRINQRMASGTASPDLI